jgi:hypothetical protein
MSGKYYTTLNESFTEGTVEKDGRRTNKENGFGIELPNGKYRFTFKVFTDNDPFVWLLQWQLEVRIRLNDEEF